jgi:thaumarchaeosortase
MVLEDIFNSTSIKKKSATTSPSTLRTLSYVTAFLTPTINVVVANYFGFNAWIVAWSVEHDVYSATWMPLAFEYLVFALLHIFLTLRFYGWKGLRDYSTSSVFLSAIGLIYAIDNIYPYGRFTPFQALVPTTVTLAEKVLNLLHYQTLVTPSEGTVHLTVWNSSGRVTLGVAWPCAGIDSLILYVVTFVQFLKKTAISWKHKAAYFLVGAIVIYLINVFRVVTIFQIAVNGENFIRFHDWSGPLYSVTGIISYLLLILGGRRVWQRFRSSKKSIVAS